MVENNMKKKSMSQLKLGKTKSIKRQINENMRMEPRLRIKERKQGIIEQENILWNHLHC